jgi:DNA-binding NarL/FixJ family response regulator
MLNCVAADVVDCQDKGCDLAPSCLDCPFERCLEDDPRARQNLLRQRRDRTILELRDEGKDSREIARLLGVSPRTVQRAIRTRTRAVTLLY